MLSCLYMVKNPLQTKLALLRYGNLYKPRNNSHCPRADPSDESCFILIRYELARRWFKFPLIKMHQNTCSDNVPQLMFTVTFNKLINSHKYL